MEVVSEDRNKEQFVRKNSGKTFKSRKHDKAEKRKQKQELGKEEATKTTEAKSCV